MELNPTILAFTPLATALLVDDHEDIIWESNKMSVRNKNL